MMAPNLTEETHLPTYTFQDSNDCVTVTLYATGAIEQKDIDVLSETDSLEVTTPANERWFFNLYDHVFSDQIDVNIEINETRTQTKIELCLHKQQKQTVWPQLYSRQSIPVTPQKKDLIDQEMDSSNHEQEPETHELSIKKFITEFHETMDNKAIADILIKEVYNCQVQFTETNFTAIFQTNDEAFLERHSIPSKMPIKLFVRVKERIKPDQCTHKVTSTCIEITLIKDNEYGPRWYRLEPNEYSESRSLIPQTPPSTLPLSTSNTNPFNNSSDNAIPSLGLRSIDRQMDKYPLGLASQQKEIIRTSNPSSAGYTGIYNPANSCFMNAALQCLSNTRELRDYFLKSFHSVEINRTNPLGMKGVMAEEFANVIKNLWTGQSSYINANRLREYAAKRHQEFVGNGQHDAQELLTIVLDAIHEDLNRVITKPQVPPIEDNNRSDDLIADEYWKGYLSRNDSIIVQLFTGQFKSKTKCPQCEKESVTFDPFTSLSVPVPKRISVDIIVTYRSDEKSPKKFRILMSSDGSIGDLKRLLSQKSGLSITKMLAYKIQGNRSIELLKDDDRVSVSNYSWNNFDLTYITEILTSTECDNENIVQLTFFQRIFKLPDFVHSCSYCQALPNPHSSPKWCQNCYRVSYCDEKCQKFHASEHKHACAFRSSDNYEVIGLPFIVSLPESKLTCENVFEQIKIHAKRSVDIHIEDSQRSFTLNHRYGEFHDDDNEEDSFSDIENIDWTTIKRTLASADSWSICRLGDYFMKKKRDNSSPKEKLPDQLEEDAMIVNEDISSENSMEDFDMLDDIYGSQPLFRIMPQTTDYLSNMDNDFEPIIGYGNDSDQILRNHKIFSIDWFTDNKPEAPLRVTPSKNRSGFNDLTDDESVLNSSTGDQDVTLQQCLQTFIEPEVLGPDDKWYCPHCKEHIQAEKKMSVWRLPPILIIHLKRFKYHHSSSYGYMSNSREKIDTAVKFPVHDLNMGPYCSSVTEENHSSQSRYNLYGIINHRGTAWFGHYTSYGRLLANNDSAKTEIGWRNFDDERVTPLANVKDLVRPDAYVLFYRHRNLSVNFSFQEQLQRVLSDSTA